MSFIRALCCCCCSTQVSDSDSVTQRKSQSIQTDKPLAATIRPATDPTLRRRLAPPPSGRIAPQASPSVELEPIGATILPNQPDMRPDEAAEPQIPFVEAPREKLEPLSAIQLRELGASDLLIDQYMKLKIPQYLGSKSEQDHYQGMYRRDWLNTQLIKRPL